MPEVARDADVALSSKAPTNSRSGRASVSFVVNLVFVFEHWEFGDIRLPAPSERPVAMTNIAAQIE
jgi:hypothetical protein